MKEIFLVVYACTLGGLLFFALHRIKMLWLYARYSRRQTPPPPLNGPLPRVCIQLPLYNESLVVEALLDKVSAIRWGNGGNETLEIQILDDSTDETTAIIERWMAANPVRVAAAHISHIRRPNRHGYKAGALSYGMTLTDAEFFAIFDADFRPEPDFLEQLMPHFADTKIGVVQARWEFANRKSSLLTRFQGVFLDAHFVVEQEARYAASLFFNFNGTAGIWRRRALDEAGGWTDDTVTEDLDVSYRAQLRGWKFIYRADYAVPSELPESMTAFKSQQRRWTKGGMQVMRKQIATIACSGAPSRSKQEAILHLLVGFVHPLLVLFAISFVPYLILAGQRPTGLWVFFSPVMALLIGAGSVAFYITAQYFRHREWREGVLWLLTSPIFMAFGLAMSVTGTVAVIEGLCQRGGEFVRTPKGGRAVNLGSIVGKMRTRTLFFAITLMELALGSLMIFGAWYFENIDRDMLAVLLCVKATGFFGLAFFTARDVFPRLHAAPAK
ncbi:glycosyltransferase [Opitutaceae bacterium TAV4]|nr:glycosyltransferase [Opitutaceae bacterium TAV4]RRJ99094.1 glycosyltransferase [Opitutaceae bacterium TAV3]